MTEARLICTTAIELQVCFEAGFYGSGSDVFFAITVYMSTCWKLRVF
jgi:hypothetical protein